MKIIIPGIPVPQARMKHASNGSYVMTYDPKAKEKKEIRSLLECKALLHDIPYPRLSFLFHMPIPKGLSKKKQRAYDTGLVKHDKKPDIDNLLKLYLDCLDGIIIQGDQKVSLGPCIKVYHPEPKTIVWISETRQVLTPWELDFAFQDGEEHDIPCFCEQDYPSDWRDLCV